METKFTKGVWNINKHSSTTVECKGRSIATTGGYSNNNDFEKIDIENKANALLISKAPEMYEMLEKCKEVFDSLNCSILSDDIEQLLKEATEL